MKAETKIVYDVGKRDTFITIPAGTGPMFGFKTQFFAILYTPGSNHPANLEIVACQAWQKDTGQAIIANTRPSDLEVSRGYPYLTKDGKLAAEGAARLAMARGDDYPDSGGADGIVWSAFYDHPVGDVLAAILPYQDVGIVGSHAIRLQEMYDLYKAYQTKGMSAFEIMPAAASPQTTSFGGWGEGGFPITIPPITIPEIPAAPVAITAPPAVEITLPPQPDAPPISTPINGSSESHYELMAIVAALKPLENLSMLYREVFNIRSFLGTIAEYFQDNYANSEALTRKANLIMDSQSAHAESFLQRLSGYDCSPFADVPPGTRMFQSNDGAKTFITPTDIIVVDRVGGIQIIGQNGMTVKPTITNGRFTNGTHQYTLTTAPATPILTPNPLFPGLPASIQPEQIGAMRWRIEFPGHLIIIVCLRRCTTTILNPNGSVAIIGASKQEGYGTQIESAFVAEGVRTMTIVSADGAVHRMTFETGKTSFSLANGIRFSMACNPFDGAVNTVDTTGNIEFDCEVVPC